ncbi:MAG: GIY-YIG nuclease family protein [Endomicrobia bacterium]|nr:GIY-YIG nuclease family protein [Endomicrobiia bacterium]
MKRKNKKTIKSPTKGALIKGMSKKLPSEILDNPVFKQRLKELMKGSAGIYALYRGNRLYYVGLTKNLFGRINWHLKDRHRGKWDKFVIFRIKRIRYLKDIETLITHLVDVPGNRIKGRVPRDANINHILKEILKQHNKEIKKITKALK